MAKRDITLCGGLNVHRLVAKTAIEMAEEMFEVYARENNIYKRLRAGGQVSEKHARNVFVARVAPKMYEDARQALASMLGRDDVTQYVKDEIYEALCLDNDLRANRTVARDMVTAPGSELVH